MSIKKITTWVIIGTIFLIPIFPLIVANSLFFPFITGKAFYFRILVEVAFASWIILAFLDTRYRPKLTPLMIGVTLFTVITLFADLLGVNPVRSLLSNFERMEGWITVVHLWALFVMSTSMFGGGEDGKKMWHYFLNTSIGVALVVAVYAIFQFLGIAAVHQSTTRVDASLGNAAYMAVYMLFHIFLAAYFFFVKSQKSGHQYSMLRWLYSVVIVTSFALLFETISIVKSGSLPLVINFVILAILIFVGYRYKHITPIPSQWFYSVLLVLFSFILLETQTRGTILGFFGGIGLTLLLYTVFGEKELKISRSVSAGIIVLLVVLSAVFWFNRNSALVKNNLVLNRIASISLSDTQTQARAYIWPMALKGAMQRPILGWGQEDFNYIFNTNYDPRMWSQEQWFDRAHSVFLDWLIASGFVGLITYLALYVLCLVAIWKSALHITEKSILTGLIAAYAVHNIFVFDNLASYVLFFAVLGFSSSLHHGKPIKLFGLEPVKLDVVEYIVAPAVLIIFVVVIYLYTIRPIQANIRLITALQYCTGNAPHTDQFVNALAIDSYMANQEIREQLISCAGKTITGQSSNQSKNDFYKLTSDQIKTQIAATPKDARIYAIAGSYYNQINQYDEALPILETAHKLSPAKQSIDLELVSDYLVKSGNDKSYIDKATQILKTAYEAAKDNTQIVQAYVITLVAAGHEDQARKMFGNDDSIFTNSQMAQVYASLKQYSKAITIYQKLLVSDPTSIDLHAQLARVQYTSGDSYGAIATLKAIAKDHPELKDQVDAAVKSIQTGK